MFSELDEYKKLAEKIIVPSSSLCGLILTYTAFSYNLYSHTIAGIIATSFLLVITAISFFYCCIRYSVFFIRNEKLQSSRILALIVLTVLLFFIIFIRISALANQKNLPDEISNFQATVINIEKKRAGAEIIVSTGNNNVKPDVEIALFYNGTLKINKSDKVFIHKIIKKNTRINSGNGFNKYSSQGIHYTASIYDNDITLLQKTDESFREIIKRKLTEKIDILFNEDAAGMIKALFTGNMSSIKKSTIFSFRDAGALHVLSASGLHIGIAAAFPMFLIFFRIGRRRILIFSIITVSAYLYITDMPVSLVRASLMFYLFAVQSFLHRKTNSFNALMLAASIIIIIAPWDIFNLGFQLSFGATLGILLFYNLYMKSFRGFPSYLKKSFSLSISSQIFSMPLIIFHLGQINTVSLLSNIIMIPLTTIFMYIASVAFFLSSVNLQLTGLLIKLTMFSYNTLIQSAVFFSDFKLNFFLNENRLLVFMFLTISLIPILPSSIKSRTKSYPVLISFMLCSLYLKYPQEQYSDEIALIYRNSSMVISSSGNILNLDIREAGDKDLLIENLRKLKIKINIININNNSAPNLTACRKITDDFVIDECRFSIFPELNGITKSLIYSMEADKIKISFPSD